MKKQVIKRNSEKYNELCHMFCTKFVETFGEISGMTYQQVEELFHKRIKKISIGEGIQAYDYQAKKIMLTSGSTEHVFIHETLHAISAQHIRRNFFAAAKSMIFKKSSDFAIDEGITEYYTCCMEKKGDFLLAAPDVAYRKEAIAMSLLGKTTNQREMMAFYLKNNPDFILSINKIFPNGYSKIKEILANAEPFPNSGFDTVELQKLAPLHNFFEQALLKPVTSIENFKENVNILLEIYRQEIFALSYRMYFNNQTSKTTSDEAQKQKLLQIINREKQKFERLREILRGQWLQLGINDDNLFNEIVLERIKEKCPYALEAIKYSNIFPVAPKKVQEDIPKHPNNQPQIIVNPVEYIQEETVSLGRKR